MGERGVGGGGKGVGRMGGAVSAPLPQHRMSGAKRTCCLSPAWASRAVVVSSGDEQAVD